MNYCILTKHHAYELTPNVIALVIVRFFFTDFPYNFFLQLADCLSENSPICHWV